ncbi:MAG: hypothetical protein KF688_04280 [Pirellulales bacterium]|nr:hypothetical protein [Pirellulales bacterium]MBX3434421.1 hypothetical protein [Pirellulales bacterium]
MGIPVKCPNGHEFNVKEKYAGKKGICPFCKGKNVIVRVPDSLSSKEITKAFAEAIAEETLRGVKPSNSDSSIFDDAADQADSASNSHLSSSVVRHNIRCRCGESVPMWFAKCPKCGTFMDHR